MAGAFHNSVIVDTSKMRAHLKASGLTKIHLAEESRCGQNTISKMSSKKSPTNRVGKASVSAICLVLGITIEDIAAIEIPAVIDAGRDYHKAVDFIMLQLGLEWSDIDNG